MMTWEKKKKKKHVFKFEFEIKIKKLVHKNEHNKEYYSIYAFNKLYIDLETE